MSINLLELWLRSYCSRKRVTNLRVLGWVDCREACGEASASASPRALARKPSTGPSHIDRLMV